MADKIAKDRNQGLTGMGRVFLVWRDDIRRENSVVHADSRDRT